MSDAPATVLTAADYRSALDVQAACNLQAVSGEVGLPIAQLSIVGGDGTHNVERILRAALQAVSKIKR